MKLELKIKMENKKEVVLDEKEAKELFEKLKEIFGTKEYIGYYPYWYKWYEIPCNITIPDITWTTTGGNVTIYNTENKTGVQ